MTVQVWATAAATLPRVGTREDDFRVLYAAEYASVAHYCWTLVRDQDMAHDLAQEAFTRLLASWIRVEDPRSYVFRVATNLVRRSWRSRSRQDETMGALAQERPNTAPGPDPVLTGLRVAVQSLPRRLRDVVLLHYYADLSVADVAAAVGRPVGTVKRQLSEARTLLAGALEVPSG